MKNYYKTLGIGQNSTKDEIKKAFRELALKYHPDRNKDQRFSEQFKEINEAKQVLLDDLKKFQYDHRLADFLTNPAAFAKGKTQRRKKSYGHSFAIELIKETVFNKFFIGLLFTVTILLTIAFLTIPAEEEAAVYSPVKEKLVSEPVKELVIVKPVVEPLFRPEKKEKKQTFIAENKKTVFTTKRTLKTSFVRRKAVKKHHFNIESKKVKQQVMAKVHLKKKKPITITASATPAINKEKVSYKQLTSGQMVQVLRDIKAEKHKLGSSSNCVQIIKTHTSNISNAFMLASFLRNYGFVISGREKIPMNSTGININIDDMNNCIMVTIGTL